MTKKEYTLSDRTCFLYQDAEATHLLIQPIDEHDLEVLDQENIPHLILGGYSLAGLFALWAGYQTDRFEGIAAASPSVWYPQWIDYASEKKPLAKSVYLSLGDKEEKAKNPVMAQVGNALRKQHELLTEQKINTILEWNAGNHFVDSDKRMAKGFAWLINNR
jgi:predicted alpha/beta superfamily hydrolase